MSTITRQDVEELKKLLRTTQVISGALLAAVAVYVGVAFALRALGALPWARPDWTRPEAAGLVTNAFLVVGAGNAVLAGVLGKAITRAAPRLGGGIQERVAAYAGRFRTAAIVRAALGESIAVLGFVLYLLYGDETALLALAAGAAVVIGAFWPTWEKLREGLRRVAPEFPGL